MPQPERKERFPEKIGQYDVLLPLASGGMGTVYLARLSGAHGFEREVAIKLMHPHLRDSEGFAMELVEEGKLAVRIRHSNVVSVLDVGEDILGLYLVMDYVEGDSLWGLLRAAQDRVEQVPIPIGIRILADALLGLHAAHEVKDASGQSVGLVHRDFSPHNILVGVDGIGRLTDFGVAKAATRVGVTGTGIVKGKMSYMSPEQARGENVDRRTDVWAAGVIAWEIVAGKKLFPSGNDASTLLKIVSSPPPPLSEVVPGIAPAIDEAVMRALSHDVEQRWPTATSFRQALLAACASVRLSAETEDVADYVVRIVGPRLERRRSRIHEVVALRQRVEVITQVEPTHTPSQSRQVPAVTRRPEVIDGAASAPPPVLVAEAEALVADTPPDPIPFVAPDAEARPRPEPTESASASHPFVARPAPAPRPPLPLLFMIGGLALLVSFVVVLIIKLGRPSKPAGSSSATAAVQSVATVVEPPVVVPPPPIDTTPAPPPPAPSHIVHVRANAPLASLRVGGRTIPIADGARQADIELTAEEAKAKTIVEAFSVDRRKATITIAPASTSVQATFAVAYAAPVPTKSAPPALAPLPYTH